MAAVAEAQCTHQWQQGQGIPGTNDEINASLVWDPDGAGPNPEVLVLGGEFSLAGKGSAWKIAIWDGQEWHGNPANFSGTIVYALAEWQGQLIAGGQITGWIKRYNGVSWNSMGALNSTVRCLANFNGQLIAGGSFTVSGSYLAAWNGTGWQPLGGVVNGTVSRMVALNGQLYVGGSFTDCGGVAAPGIARWDGQQWHALESGSGSQITSFSAITEYEGALHVAGTFSFPGGYTAQGVARWENGEWIVLGNGVDSYVKDLRVHKGQLILSGWFNVEYFGAELWRIARWDGKHWQPMDGGMMGFNGNNLNTVAEFQGDLIAAGSIYTAGSENVNNLARWDGSHWHRVGAGFNGAINAFTVWQGQVCALGTFRTAGNTTARAIALWDGSGPDGWHPLGTGLQPLQWTIGFSANAACDWNGDLVAGGQFRRAGDVFVNNLASWNGTEWSDVGGGVTSDSTAIVCAATSYRGDLIVGGEFTKAGSVTVTNIARWDGSEWHQMASGLNARVNALLVHNGELIACGGFTAAGSVPVLRVARWNGTEWEQMGAGATGAVRCATIHEGTLFIGGGFTTSGGSAGTGVMRWSGTAWEGLGSSPGSVYSLASVGSRLFVGGAFTQLSGGIIVNRVAVWDGDTWGGLADGIDYQYSAQVYTPNVNALIGVEDALWAGGSFTKAGTEYSQFLAIWAPNPFATNSADFNCDGAVDGADLGQFLQAWGECSGCPADFDGDGIVGGADLGLLLGSWSP